MTFAGNVAIIKGGFHRNRLILRLTPTMAAAVQGAVVFQALSRGVDYIAAPSNTPTPNTLSYVEQAVPLPVAGWIFTVAALLAYLGMLLDRVPLAAVSHALIGILYGIFGAGQLIEISTRDDWFGWRTGTGFLVAAAIHGVCARASQTSWRIARAYAR